MANALRDGNYVPGALGVDSTNPSNVLPFKINPVTGRILAEVSGSITAPHNSLTGIDGNGTIHLSQSELDSLTKTPSVSTTEVASQGGLLVNIDNAVGDVARTTTGYIEDGKYGFYFSSSAGTSSAEFDSAEKMTGRLVLKLSSVTSDGLGRVSMFFNGTGAGGNTLVPVKPSTKYVLSIPYGAANTASGHTCIVFATNSNVPGSALSVRNTTEIPSGTYKRQIVKTTFTTSATDTFIGLQFRMNTPGNISDIFVDVNSMILEEVVEPVTNSLTSKSPSLVGFTAVGSTDNVDQSQLTNNANLGLGTVSEQYISQPFTPSKNNFTGAVIQKVASVGTLAGNITVSVVNDNAGNPGTTVFASYSYTPAQWDAIPNSTDSTVNLPCKLVAGTPYWLQLSCSTADNANYALVRMHNGSSAQIKTWNGTAWSSAITRALYFKTLYYKPSTNFTARQNNEVVSISADSDGFLEGAKIDLENGSYAFDTGYEFSVVPSRAVASSFHSFTQNGAQNLNAQTSFIDGNGAFVLKVNLPKETLDGINVSWSVYDATVRQNRYSYSFDNVTYSTPVSATGGSAWVLQNFTVPGKFTTVYVKFDSANAGLVSFNQLAITAKFDTSSFKTLYNFPTNQNLYATYVKTLATATTTATYRATKYGFPAIEFAENVYTFLKTDTTATGSTVAFSADGVTYSTVTDGTNIALTSTTYPIVYVRSNITANRLYVSSNDYNADSAKDGSLKCNVQYKSLTQGIIYDVQELQEKVNDLYTKPATEVQLYQKPLITQVKEGLFEFFNNSLYFTNLAVRRSVQQAHGIITTPVTVANTTTETTVFSVTQGANYLRAGKMIIPRLLGKYSTNGNSDSFTVRVKYGGVTVLSVNSATAPSVTNRTLFIESYNTVRSIGATGTMQTFLQTIIDNVANNADALALATINSTVAQALEITVQWNAASVNNTITIEQGYCEAIDA